VTCDDVRDQLAEHLLGSLDPATDREVRRHLRGCASCRADMAALAEGVDTLARATHDVEPPEELRGKVLGAIQQEWADADDVIVLRETRRPALRIAVAAALAAAVVWAGVATVRSIGLQEDAQAYRTFLSALDGEDVRVAALEGAGVQEFEGSVVVYDSTGGQSWVVVLARAPGWGGRMLNVTLLAGERTIDLRPLEFGAGGEASTWLATTADLTRVDGIRLWDDGGLVASAHLEHV